MNFEDSMRKSFEPDSFEFDEAHWEGAKVLLDKEFARRALYRKLGWTGVGVFLISVLVYVGIQHFREAEEKYNPLAGMDAPASVDSSTLDSKTETNYSLDNEKTALEKADNMQSNAVSSGLSSDYSASDIPKWNDQSKVNSDISVIRTEDINIRQHQEAEVHAISESDEPIDSEKNGKDDFSNDEPEIDFIKNEKESIAETSDESTLFSEKSDYSVDLLEQLAVEQLMTSSIEDYLSIKMFQHRKNDGRFTVFDRKVSHFASAEMMVYPSDNNDFFNFVGFSLGFSRQAPLSKQFFYELGLRGAVRMGEFSPSVRSTQLSFDFGTRQNEFQLDPTAVYSLQIPIFVGVDLSTQHQLSAGVIPAFLLGVRGTSVFQSALLPWEVANNLNSQLNTIDRGWLDKSGFNSFALSYAIRYHYKVSEGFQVGVSAQYRPGDWVGEDYGKFFDFDSMEYIYSPEEQRNLVRRNWIIALEMRYGF